jgi:hypothetical protein
VEAPESGSDFKTIEAKNARAVLAEFGQRKSRDEQEMTSTVFSDSCCYYRLAVLVGRHIRLVGQPFKLSRTPSQMVAPPPEFSEQTDEVLAEFGFSAGEIAELRKAKVV